MTPDRIIARNRANAQKSTGPKTLAGKAIVAGNARQHGATAGPDPENIATWLRIILDRPDITPGDLLPHNDRGMRALTLAQAEAALNRCEEALYSFVATADQPDQVPGSLKGLLGQIAKDLHNRRASVQEIAAAIRAAKPLVRQTRDMQSIGGKRHQLLKRYLCEARARRNRAFRQWCAVAALDDRAAT